MAASITTTELTPLAGYEPESLGGVRIFRNVRARGDDIKNWAAEHPGMLDGSKWVGCDLDTTAWPDTLRDITIVDSSMRGTVFNLKEAHNVSVSGTQRIPMSLDPETHLVVANLDQVSARIDGMQVLGNVSGFSLRRVAGDGVVLGAAPANFFEQRDAETLTYGGMPLRLDTATVQLSYLQNFTAYLDGEDVSFYKNNMPNFQLGGKVTRGDISETVAPSMTAVGIFDGLNANKLVSLGAVLIGSFRKLFMEEATIKGVLRGIFRDARTRGTSLKEVDTEGADFTGSVKGFEAPGTRGSEDPRRSGRKDARKVPMELFEVGSAAALLGDKAAKAPLTAKQIVDAPKLADSHNHGLGGI